MNPYLPINRNVWDHKAENQGWYVDTASDKDFQDPLKVADPQGWLEGKVLNKRILCLAAGGGRHGPLFAAAGAKVTVYDLSPAMLELDKQVATRRNLEIRVVCDTMENLGNRDLGKFDVVFMPVSSCYIPTLKPVYEGVARCLQLNGIFISYHKQPATLQSSNNCTGTGNYPIIHPYVAGYSLPAESESCGYREHGTREFLHTWKEIIGGLCEEGFVVEDLAEPKHGKVGSAPGTFQHRSVYLPPFVGVKARLINPDAKGKSGVIWVY